MCEFCCLHKQRPTNKRGNRYANWSMMTISNHLTNNSDNSNDANDTTSSSTTNMIRHQMSLDGFFHHEAINDIIQQVQTKSSNNKKS